MTEQSAASLRQIDVRTSNGQQWVAHAISAEAFRQTLSSRTAIAVDVPGGVTDSGWSIATAHVVAWRVERNG